MQLLQQLATGLDGVPWKTGIVLYEFLPNYIVSYSSTAATADTVIKLAASTALTSS